VLVVVVLVLGVLLVGAAAMLRLALGSGTGPLLTVAAVGAVVVVAALVLGVLTGVDAGPDDAAVDPPTSAPAREVDEATGDVEHDPVRLWTGLGIAALLLVVAAVLLRRTDWAPIGPDPWDGDDPPEGGRVGSGPGAAPP
jgi:hypothetical protein